MTLDPGPPPTPPSPSRQEVMVGQVVSGAVTLACIGGLIASMAVRRNPEPAVLTTLGTIGGAAASNIGNLMRRS